MKVYVVTSGIYSDYHIVAVFDDKQKAEVFCAAYNDNNMEHRTWDDPCYIEEYDTEENHAESNKPVNYWVTVCKNFKGRHVVADDKACTFMPTKKFVETERNDTWGGDKGGRRSRWNVSLWWSVMSTKMDSQRSQGSLSDT